MTTTAEPTPVWDEMVAELGPLFNQVDTDFVLLQSMTVLAMAERQP